MPRVMRFAESSTLGVGRRLLLLSGVSVLLLTGCGSGGGETSSDQGSQTAPPTEVADGGDDATGGSGDLRTPKIVSYLDFSGPFAASGEPVEQFHRLLIDWFNEERGREIGVEVQYESFDTGYDPARTVDVHARVVEDENVVGLITFGVPNVSAIQERLPSDGLPVVHGAGAYGLMEPGAWVFTPLGDYADYFATGIRWKQEQLGLDRPLRVGYVTFDGIAGHDWSETLARHQEQMGFEMVVEEYVPPTESDVGANAERIADADPDVLIMATSGALEPLLLEELAARDFDFSRIIHSQHTSLGFLEELGVPEDHLTGSFEVNSIDYIDTTSEAYQVFEARQDEFDTRWASDTLLHLPSTLVLLQAIEAAAEAGADAPVTGEAVHEALISETFDGFGVIDDVTFSAEDPKKGVGELRIFTYENGAVTHASDWLELVRPS